MAQIQFTLDQEEILQLLSCDKDEAFKKLFGECLNSLLKVESQEQLQAGPYERTEKRADSRNGYYDRELTTRLGTITLHVPRHRNEPFKTMIFDNYSRSEGALISTMAEMVVNGVSTRKIATVMETLCGKGYSKSAVSEFCKILDEGVEAFRNRPLTDSYPFVTVDATYFKVREDHRIVSKAFMIAYGTSRDGRQEVLGFGIYAKESTDTWQDFFRQLKAKGLRDVQMITSDAHEGLRNALHREFPETAWQRCQFHFSRNITGKVPKKYQAGLRSELTDMFNSKDEAEARKKRDAIISEYMDVAEEAMKCLDEGFDSSITALSLPSSIYRHYRTSNHIERLNRELKRRSKEIGIFPNAGSLMRVVGSVLEEQDAANSQKNRIFGKDMYQRISGPEIRNRLRLIAEVQCQLQAV